MWCAILHFFSGIWDHSSVLGSVQTSVFNRAKLIVIIFQNTNYDGPFGIQFCACLRLDGVLFFVVVVVVVVVCLFCFV